MAIRTARLELVPGALELIDAARDDPGELGRLLAARVPASWPPEYLDRPALEFTRAKMEAAPSELGWWLYFVVLRDKDPARHELVGTCGYVGPPAADGTVEIGYSIVAEHQRRGYATEAVRGLLARAFALAEVRRVIADTLPALEPSIGVLVKSGFRLIGEGSAPGVVRFELTREAFERTPPSASDAPAIVPFEERHRADCAAILARLPEWFGIPAANEAYLATLGRLATSVVSLDGTTAAFMALEPLTPHAGEIHVMAVGPEFRRRGIGRALVHEAETWLRQRGGSLLHVKTLAPSHPDPHYAETRAFYSALGFLPLLETTAFWGEKLPTLMLVKALR